MMMIIIIVVVHAVPASKKSSWGKKRKKKKTPVDRLARVGEDDAGRVDADVVDDESRFRVGTAERIAH